MKIYFAHAIPDYGSRSEQLVMKWFDKKGWGDSVINPGAPEFQSHCCKTNMSYWKGVVEGCMALYFLRYKGQIPSGVGQEIQTAIAAKIPVVELVPMCDGFDLVRWQKCPEFLDYEATKRLIYPERYQKVES